VIGGSLIADSIITYAANTNGEANWISSGYTATTFDGNNPKVAISYIDLSAYGLPGLTQFSKTNYTFPSANVKTSATYNLLQQMPGDSIVSYFDGKKDTATYEFRYDEDLEMYEPAYKSTSKYNSKGDKIEEIDFNYNTTTMLYEYSSKNEFIEVSFMLDIQKSYSWTNNAWVLNGYDSTFYDSKGNKTLEKSYYKNSITDKIEYTGRTIVKESFEIIPSSPVPAAPSNLKVVLTNARTTETLASTSYTLTWQDNSYNETGFEIQRRKLGDSKYTTIGKVGANVTTYTDNSAIDGDEYFYAVIALNKDFKSALSSPVSSKPTGIISDESNSLKVAVFPNPTTEKWFVSGISNAKNVSLSTVDGHAIDFAIQADAIDAFGLNNGVYILKVEDANGITRTAKVFKK